jgi:hypothetical protein
MNWYAAKLLADEFAADRQRTAGTHRRVGGNPARRVASTHGPRSWSMHLPRRRGAASD